MATIDISRSSDKRVVDTGTFGSERKGTRANTRVPVSGRPDMSVYDCTGLESSDTDGAQQPNHTLHEFEESCPNGRSWCDGADSDKHCCLGCFEGDE